MSNNKLKQLCQIEDVSLENLIENAVIMDDCKGICVNKDCNYTTEVEPDQDQGYCEICNTNTVKYCLVLAGII